MPWATLCNLDELTEGKGLPVSVDGYTLAVFLHDGRPQAIDDICPHAGGSMSGGFVDGGCAVCPWHYWPFRLDNGELQDQPNVKIGHYPTRVHEFHGRQLVQADLPGV